MNSLEFLNSFSCSVLRPILKILAEEIIDLRGIRCIFSLFVERFERDTRRKVRLEWIYPKSRCFVCIGREARRQTCDCMLVGEDVKRGRKKGNRDR